VEDFVNRLRAGKKKKGERHGGGGVGGGVGLGVFWFLWRWFLGGVGGGKTKLVILFVFGCYFLCVCYLFLGGVWFFLFGDGKTRFWGLTHSSVSAVLFLSFASFNAFHFSTTRPAPGPLLEAFTAGEIEQIFLRYKKSRRRDTQVGQEASAEVERKGGVLRLQTEGRGA